MGDDQEGEGRLATWVAGEHQPAAQAFSIEWTVTGVRRTVLAPLEQASEGRPWVLTSPTATVVTDFAPTAGCSAEAMPVRLSCCSGQVFREASLGRMRSSLRGGATWWRLQCPVPISPLLWAVPARPCKRPLWWHHCVPHPLDHPLSPVSAGGDDI